MKNKYFKFSYLLLILIFIVSSGAYAVAEDVKYIDMETIYEKGNPTSHFNALKDSYLVHKEFFIILILIIITLIIVII